MVLKKCIPLVFASAMMITSNVSLAQNYNTTYTTENITVIQLQGVGLPPLLANQLQLSPKQRYDIETIITKSHKKLKPIQQKLDNKKHQVAGMVLLDYNKSTLQSLTKSIGQLSGQQTYIEIDAKHQIYSVLTPIQRHQVKQFVLRRAYANA